MQKAQQEDQGEIEGLEQSHTKALEENRFTLEQQLPVTFKFSSELLNLRKI